MPRDPLAVINRWKRGPGSVCNGCRSTRGKEGDAAAAERGCSFMTDALPPAQATPFGRLPSASITYPGSALLHHSMSACAHNLRRKRTPSGTSSSSMSSNRTPCPSVGMISVEPMENGRIAAQSAVERMSKSYVSTARAEHARSVPGKAAKSGPVGVRRRAKPGITASSSGLPGF